MSAAVDIDTGSERYAVAWHEAAHVAVAEALGWTVLYAWAGDTEGEMDDRPPEGQDERTTALESAAIGLAGPLANHRLAGYVPHGCDSDIDGADDELAEWGLSPAELAEVEVWADALVIEQLDRIEEIAAELYWTGQFAV